MPTTVRGENGFGSTVDRLSVLRDTDSATGAPITSSLGDPGGAEFPNTFTCAASVITDSRQARALESLNSRLAHDLRDIHDETYMRELIGDDYLSTIPALPTTFDVHTWAHRDKIPVHTKGDKVTNRENIIPFPAMVARPVGTPEIARAPLAPHARHA